MGVLDSLTSSKMHSSSICLSLVLAMVVLSHLPITSSTVAITLGTVMFNAAQVSTLAAVGALGALGAVAAGVGTAAAGAAVGAVGGVIGGDVVATIAEAAQGRKRREVDQKEITLEMLVSIEPEDCYKRIICSVATGKINNERMRNVLKLFSEEEATMRASLSKKFVEAAHYGEVRKNVAKCEHRYQCSLPMEIIQQIF